MLELFLSKGGENLADHAIKITSKSNEVMKRFEKTLIEKIRVAESKIRFPFTPETFLDKSWRVQDYDFGSPSFRRFSEILTKVESSISLRS
ncbi:MAG: hypothetical protein Crog4KO_36400 [Crocinitomicaceae bacterium]